MSTNTKGLSGVDVAQLSALSTLDAARMYASHGVSIIPVDAGESKKPLIKWLSYQRQAANQATVDRWFTKEFPTAGIGIIAGKLNGILAADFDSTGDADFFFDRFPYTKDSLRVRTPRGFHIYFQHRDGLKNHIGLFDRHIDIRTVGGYVRAPTSPGYMFLNEGRILPPPPELIAALTSEDRTIKTKAARDGDLILEGIRNDSLFRVGCGLQGAGYRDFEIAAALEELNAGRVTPPLARDEVAAICQSIVSRYPKGRRSSAACYRTAPGYYLCRAIAHYPMEWKDRRSHTIEWQDITTDSIYRQFFNHHHRFPLRSKAVINYFLLFGELPKRLDRLDFARFVGSVPIVEIADSKPTVEWAKDLPGLTLPDGMVESRVKWVICPVPTLSLSNTKRKGEGGQ